jgi:hypothetical protein
MSGLFRMDRVNHVLCNGKLRVHIEPILELAFLFLLLLLMKLTNGFDE